MQLKLNELELTGVTRLIIVEQSLSRAEAYKSESLDHKKMLHVFSLNPIAVFDED
jgi:hypothetical protein